MQSQFVFFVRGDLSHNGNGQLLNKTEHKLKSKW